MPPLFYKRGIKRQTLRLVIARSVSQYLVIARSVSDEAISLSQKGELKAKIPELHSRQATEKRCQILNLTPFFTPFLFNGFNNLACLKALCANLDFFISALRNNGFYAM